jgi:pyrroline-5-carboxylate reductase
LLCLGVQKSDVTRIVLIGVKPQYRHEFYSLLGKDGYNLNANIVCSILAGVTYEMLKKEVFILR